jgi:uncharacterized repeat protein (TIGR01451 family)
MRGIILKQFLLACSILFSTSLFSQSLFTVTGLSIDTSWVSPCDSIISLSFSPVNQNFTGNENYLFTIQGSNFNSGPIVVMVNWGDGTSNTYTGQSTGVGIPIQFSSGSSPSHVYTNPGNPYMMVVTVSNPNNSSSATLTETVYIGGCSGYIYAVPEVDCNGDSLIDSTLWNTAVPIELVSNLGTVYSGTLINGLAFIPNMPNGFYTAQINSIWLTANNYTVASISPATISISPTSQNTLQILLNCITVPLLTGCTVGQIYCDDNDNGVFDANDIGIPSAPVIISYNGQSYYGITNTNGIYTISYPNPNLGAAIVTVNSGWLAQSGYFLQNNSQTTTVTQCTQASNLPVNFAVDCDSSTVQSECVIGWVFCDANANGILDSGEVTIPYAPVSLTGNGNIITVYANSNGVFNYSGFGYLGAITTVSVSQYWLTQHGYTAINSVLSTTTNCNSLTPTYFGINCGITSGCADLWTTVTPWIGYYQNQTNYVKLKWGNYGLVPGQSYILTMTYPAGVTPITSSISNSNYVISGNTITWSITGSNQMNFLSTDIIYFSVPGGLTNGTQHIYSSTITATGTNADCYSANNNGSLMMILGNSYDPNDKNVSATTIINPAVQDELTYTVRFQNTGTAPAQDVYILDTLSANLDWTTMKMINASHDMQLIDLGNGVMKFNFPGIWLPDSTSNEPLSHGEFTYSIKEKVGNGIGSQILNTAHIYFDWNSAIVTNTTLNVNGYLSVKPQKLDDFTVSPNPFANAVTIASSNILGQIVITDLMGKTVYKIISNEKTTNLDLSTIQRGVYLISIYSNGTTSTSRIVKQ